MTSLIKVRDLAYIRYAAPDLGPVRRFLEDFGMVAADDGTRDGVLRMKGAGPRPYLHETCVGEPGFRAIALQADGVEDLERLAAAIGAAVMPLATPGGGYMVALTDPDGISVEVVAGQKAEPMDIGGRCMPRNSLLSRDRVNVMHPFRPGASAVFRLGHGVLRISDLRRSEAWWKDHFGLLTSDEVVDDDSGQPVGIFLRCDRGAKPSDHHSLLLAPHGPGAAIGFHHAAYEVLDLDDLMRGRDHMLRQGHRAVWGIGRHVLGGQIFDYWLDPFGNRLEHWTDGDLFTADHPARITALSVMRSNHWGDDALPEFYNPGGQEGTAA